MKKIYIYFNSKEDTLIFGKHVSLIINIQLYIPPANIFGLPTKFTVLLKFTSTTWSITCVQPFKNKALRPPQPLTSAWMPSLVTWSHQEMFNCSNSGHPSLRTKQNETNIWLNPIPKASKSHFIGYLVREWLQPHAFPQEYTHLLNTDLECRQSHNKNKA